MKANKKELILDGLGCANCAAKIETQVKEVKGVNNAQVNFVLKKLTIEVDNKEELNKIIERAKSIIKDIEPDVNVVDFEMNSKDEADRDSDKQETLKKIIQLSIGVGFFVIGLILDSANWIRPYVFFISYVIVGGEILLRALKNITRGQVFDENFLMSIATIGAFVIGEFPEGVAVMLFYQVGEFFQDIAVNRSRNSITALMDIKSDYANLKVHNEIRKVSPEEVRVGDIIIVKPGERVPLDGRITEGSSMLDASALTGESVPVEAEAGDDILSGVINLNGVLTVEVTKEFRESTVSRILDLVQNASSRKAPTEQFITRFARYYTPAVVIAALALALIPPLVIEGSTFSEWLYKALVLLVISCPCALVISIPLGYFGGIGAASKNGILVKGSSYLEALNNVETVIFDKTGTLTKGIFDVTEVNPQDNYSQEKLLEYAAYAESYSNHPIAASILKAYHKEIDKSKITSYEEISGHGIKVKVEEDEILVGNEKLMEKEKINFSKVQTEETILHVSVNKAYAGSIVIADAIKADSVKAIKSLKKIGVKKTVMLTGDTRSVGEKVANQLALDEVYAELLPAEKVERLEMLDSQKSAGSKLVFVGDGINDAPVLARADVGIAMGGLGSDAAIEAADVVIMTDEPSKIAESIMIAKRTRRIVWQNILFALGVKAVFLLLAALGITTMWEAVFADVGVALLAVINAMRVIRYRNIVHLAE